MAKKKQLAGKKTKLARLPLTRALSGQDTEGPWQPPEQVGQPPLLPRETVADEVLGPLAEVYLYLVQELNSLQSELNSSGNSSAAPAAALFPQQPRDPVALELALWRARQGLRDLRGLLSP